MKTAITNRAVLKSVGITMALCAFLVVPTTKYASAQSGYGYAVGASGTILCYDGNAWMDETNGGIGKTALNAVSTLATGEAWAVGNRLNGKDGAILHRGTGDCPANWKNETTNGVTDVNLWGVFAKDPKHVWAVGEKGTILYFNGEKWTKFTVGGNDAPTLYSVNVKGAYGYAVGVVGKDPRVFRAANPTNKDSWKPMTLPPKLKNAGAARAVAWAETVGSPTTSSTWVVGETDNFGVWRYDGSQWLPESENGGLKGHGNLRAVQALDQWSVWAGGELKNGDLPNVFNRPSRSSDWFNKSTQSKLDVYGIAFITSEIGWVVGKNGDIFQTKNGDAKTPTWENQTNPKQGNDLNSIAMLKEKKMGTKLNQSTSPDSGTAGSSYVSLDGSPFPDGSINPANIAVQLATECYGDAAATTSAVSVVSGTGDSKLVSFLLPAGLAPGQYFVSISDSADGDANFESSNCSEVNVSQ